MKELTEYPQIDLSAWEQKGEGGNGATYTNPSEPGVLLKVSYLELAKADSLVQEFNTSKAVYELGVPTPRMLQLVSVNGTVAIKCQAITGKKSFARLCSDNPGNIDQYAMQMAGLGKQLHATDASGNEEYIPSMKSFITQAISVSAMLSDRARKRVQNFVDTLDDVPTLLHGDFTFSNLVTADGKPYWIDLGRATHGDPFFDLGHFYLFCNIFSRQKRVQDIAHMTDKQMVQFWNSFAATYNGPDNLDEFTRKCKRFAALDIIIMGHVQPLNMSERFFLSMLVKSIIKD